MMSTRIRIPGLIAGLAAAALLASPLAAAPAQPGAGQNEPPAPSVVKEFGDWTVRCYPVKSASPCEMIELLVNKKTNRRVLGLLVAYVPSRDQHIVQVAVPLGVMLQSGAVLASDTFTSAAMRFRRCDGQGCYVETGIDNDSINALSRATKASMQVVMMDGKKYNLNLSLKGFSAAHATLLDLTRQNASAAPAAAPAGGQ